MLAASFDNIGNDPQAWRGTARELLTAAAVLRERMPTLTHPPPHSLEEIAASSLLLSPLLLLRACAVECLLKVLLLERGEKLAQGGAYVGSPDHDLVRMAKKAGFEATGPEPFLLERLFLWNEYGRYPIPKTSQRWLTAKGQGITVEVRPLEGDRDVQYVKAYWSIGDEAPFEGLLSKLQVTAKLAPIVERA